MTLLTQVGGVVWLLCFYIFSKIKAKPSKLQRLAMFVVTYLVISIFLIPNISKFGGRERLPISQKNNLVPHNYFTVICNRNYVTADFHKTLKAVAKNYAKEFSSSKISYLDANFPFFDGFPLLPHISHSDGRKIDLSFQYLKDNKPTQKKPSTSGYGAFVGPTPDKNELLEKCKKTNAIYGFTKYLRFGGPRNLSLDEVRTKRLIKLLLREGSTHKIFIEPHLKQRMRLSDPRIRFQGCHSVRHDDHIHWQVL
ncbi:hypothetical protein N9B82_01485 [Saprospiraceae bacterium]|nr:hypothetical protein [Saprospiraceae bacterium]